MKPFNLEEAKAGKPIICRNGFTAKFVAHVPDAIKSDRIVCLDHESQIFTRPESGETGGGCYDLFMIPEKKTAWANIYRNGDGFVHENKEAANRAIGLGASDERIACIEVTYEEGQGLS